MSASQNSLNKIETWNTVLYSTNHLLSMRYGEYCLEEKERNWKGLARRDLTIRIMLVSYKWLKELVDIDVPSQELAEKMSTTGIEVEGVESTGLLVSQKCCRWGLVLWRCARNSPPCCQVNVGEEEARQIVCGAPNVRAGIKVMVALPGARIADNYKIKKGKIRGLESLGMICSLGELGISDSVVPKEFADGIQILPRKCRSWGWSHSHI